ncbi:cuticle protein 10.9-like [Varroa jacobsoni]|uniref:Cuticle protein n=1 Tax=Varroa destructor TaxID=109461 RepID=A0A7M7JA84_VARDE|nr:adult-specific rigid cuticular protein 15.7-like [Varroa destructor]XP_022708137.1 cuticle protein 10.9-like [Varroa jacobsoni]
MHNKMPLVTWVSFAVYTVAVPSSALLPHAPLAVAPAPVAAVPAPQPYSFGYDTQDEFGTRQTRSEVSNAVGAKVGSYGYTDPHGIYRQVNYIADAAGFRASISTNEPGTSASATGAALYNAPTTYVAPAPARIVATPIAPASPVLTPNQVHYHG